MTALPLSIDALYDVLDELAPLLRREAAGEPGEGQPDYGPREEAEARRQQRRVEREGAHQAYFVPYKECPSSERKRVKRSAREAALRREGLRRRLSNALKALRTLVSFLKQKKSQQFADENLPRLTGPVPLTGGWGGRFFFKEISLTIYIRLVKSSFNKRL